MLDGKCESKMGLRRTARYYAVQMVYRASITGTSMKKIDEENHGEIFIAEEVSIAEKDEDFFRQLLETMDEKLSAIDEIIDANLSDRWKMDRLDNVMKSILRLGAAELLYLKNIPHNVVFNEYIEISKLFFEKSEVAFVNGLLNSIARLEITNQLL